MPRRRPLLTVVVGVVVVLLVLVDGAGWLPVRDDEPDGSLRVAGLHELLDELVAKPAVAPGAAAALLTPQGSWSGATGMADIEARRPLLPDNRFRIASITKTYVAASCSSSSTRGPCGSATRSQRACPTSSRRTRPRSPSVSC
jgi:hypothetical protein